MTNPAPPENTTKTIITAKNIHKSEESGASHTELFAYVEPVCPGFDVCPIPACGCRWLQLVAAIG